MTDPYLEARLQMVERQIAARGVRDARVLEALKRVPRHLFIDEKHRHEAYEDHPVAIGHAQTISQPYIVGSMTAELRLEPSARVLEVGTGCGYQTAILAEIAEHVYSVERIEELSCLARRNLSPLEYSNITLKVGDGSLGWADASPFDAIIVTAATFQIPPALTRQLAVGGRMVLPVQVNGGQYLVRCLKTESGLTEEHLYPVRFVPLL